MKKYLTLFLILFMCLNLSACENTDNKTHSSAKEKVLNSKKESQLIYGSTDYIRINPAMDEHCEIALLLFDGLLRRDTNNYLIPGLAKEWEYNEEENYYRFYLKPGIVWHDGVAFSAEDVKFTFEAIMDASNCSENSANYEEIKDIAVDDDLTVTFYLSEKNTAFPDYMTMPVMPKHRLIGEDWQESEFFINPIGTGPYKLEKWDMGQSISLVKNEDYFGKIPEIEKIIFKIIPDDNARAMQLLSGEINLAQVAPKDVSVFEKDSNFKVYDMNTSDYRGILYNFNNEFWKENADLIPAINYAVDRKIILDTVLLGYGEEAYGPLQRNIYNYENVEHYDYNPVRAEEILKSAGCEKNQKGYWERNGKVIGFTINAPSGDRVRVDMAQALAGQLKDIGLDVKAAALAGGIDWEGQECYLIGWGSPFDADDHTYKVFGSGKGANYSGYSNEMVDKYLKEARQTGDESGRSKAYMEFQKALSEKPAYTFICYVNAVYVADSSISGIKEDMVLGHHGVGIFGNISDWEINN